MKVYFMIGETSKINLYPVTFLYQMPKRNFLIEKGQSDVAIIRDFHDWLPSKNNHDPPYDAEVFKRYTSTFKRPGQDVAHPATIDPREVSRLYTAAHQFEYCQLYVAFQM